MKYLKVYFILFISVGLFIGCNKGDNPLVSDDSTWTRCQGLPNLAITSFSASGDKLVAGTYNALLSQAYIFISVDNGSSWALDTTFHVNNKLTYNHLYLGTPVTFFADGAYLFAGIGGGYRGNVYVSTDNGISWSDKGISWPMADTITGAEDINSFTSMGGNIFAGTDHGVFLSIDHGMNWKSASVGLPRLSPFGLPPQVMRIVAQGTDLFAGTTGEGIFLSIDNGESWTAVDGGLTNTSMSIYGLASIGSKIFSGVFEFNTNLTGGVFVSTNEGASWSVVDNGLTNHTINVLTANSTNLFAGTNSGTFLSTNLGATWLCFSKGTPVDSLAVGAISVINSHLFVGTGYGAWRYPLSQLSIGVQSKPNRIQ
jgi:ligand-binding sensor domain-containing protein